MLTFKAGDELSIPEVAGVYAYMYNPFQRSRLGIYLDKKPSAKEVLEAKHALRRKLVKYSEVKSSVSLMGELRETRPYGISGHIYEGQLKSRRPISDWTDIEKLSENEFIAYISMAENAYAMFQPLYCGMTVEQGLRSRYIQHKLDNSRSKSGTFGGRLAELEIDWLDVQYICVPISISGDYRLSIELLEKHLINLFEPILSRR